MAKRRSVMSTIVKICSMPLTDFLFGILRRGSNWRSCKHRLLNVPKVTILLWMVVLFLLAFLFIDSGFYGGDEGIKEFTKDHPPVTESPPAKMKAIGEDTHVVVSSVSAADKRKTVYRKPPARPVPPQPDLTGKFPKDGVIIGADGSVKASENTKNTTLTQPQASDTIESRVKKAKEAKEINGKLIGWDHSLNRPNNFDLPSATKPPKVDQKVDSKSDTDGGLLSNLNPWNYLKGFGWGKPKPVNPPGKPAPTFPSPLLENKMRNSGPERRDFPKTIRQDSCDKCFTYEYKHMINPTQLCSPTRSDQTPEIILLILSRALNAVARKTIRSTYGRYSRMNSGSVRYVFIVGSNLNAMQQKLLDAEANTYNDILQGEFKESAFSNTYKAIGGLNWVQKYCSTVKHIVRTDDETYVNIPSMSRMIKTKEAILESAMTGKCNLVSKVIREPRNQWYVAYEEYPDGMYPPYCTASTYIMSQTIARAIINASPDVPYFVFDDVYVGLVMKKLKLNLYSQATHFNVPLLSGCPDGQPWFTVSPVSPTSMRKIWDKCQDFKIH